jgi:hypothetical protein
MLSLAGTITHLTDDTRYRRLNTVICAWTGDVRPRSDQSGSDVAELIWESHA